MIFWNCKVNFLLFLNKYIVCKNSFFRFPNTFSIIFRFFFQLFSLWGQNLQTPPFQYDVIDMLKCCLLRWRALQILPSLLFSCIFVYSIFHRSPRNARFSYVFFEYKTKPSCRNVVYDIVVMWVEEFVDLTFSCLWTAAFLI